MSFEKAFEKVSLEGRYDMSFPDLAEFLVRRRQISPTFLIESSGDMRVLRSQQRNCLQEHFGSTDIRYVTKSRLRKASAGWRLHQKSKLGLGMKLRVYLWRAESF